MRIDLQPAYVLHARPYRDTSLLVDLLTPDHGRITAIARGVRQSKGHKRQLLNPFQRLLVNWQGKSELKLITSFESDHHQLLLQGNHLYAGFYINELLVRLLPEHDVMGELFSHYEFALNWLARAQPLEPMLRRLEFFLLEGLGYALDFSVDARSQQPINPEGFYCCNLQEGFYWAPEDAAPASLLPGHLLLAIAAGDYSRLETLRLAKQLSRLFFKPLLGRRPLKSRELFTAPSASGTAESNGE